MADLTISKQGCEAIDENQSFIFTVTGDPNDKNTKGYYQKVVVKGNTSVTIKDLEVGSYIVTEDTGWSWRYVVTNGDDGSNSITQAILPQQKNEFEFINKRKNIYWLNGCSIAVNFWESKDKITRKETPNTTTTN